MRPSLRFLAPMIATLTLVSCAAGAGSDADWAPESLEGLTLRLVEPDNGVDNSWDFTTATEATLAGGSPAPYTYSKESGTESVLEFVVQGTDRYEMTWTSTEGGTCTESFDGGTPVDCTFTVE